MSGFSHALALPGIFQHGGDAQSQMFRIVTGSQPAADFMFHHIRNAADMEPRDRGTARQRFHNSVGEVFFARGTHKYIRCRICQAESYCVMESAEATDRIRVFQRGQP